MTTGSSQNKKQKLQVRKPIRVIHINFQSLWNKKPELLEIINSCKTDIIIGTDTWLDKSIPPTDFFQSSLYNVYRNDRPTNNKNQSHGGVLIAFTKESISSEIVELKTDSEIVWAKLNISGTKKICVGSYYRPPSDKGTSLEQLNISLNRLDNTTTTNNMVRREINLTHRLVKTSIHFRQKILP
ncbi:unnamed protein product [Mytilus coruscus]|uniref:Endonuclease/exonuclease/phosphatase domain-containing protein n=1 Tax=Mytilus coruscus TaxID=42192 RepID=A0A6J8EZD0_MYTCO|nr:unnamed protein product [Mytilus coruscus]